jgi:hypothetical protein
MGYAGNGLMTVARSGTPRRYPGYGLRNRTLPVAEAAAGQRRVWTPEKPPGYWSQPATLANLGATHK